MVSRSRAVEQGTPYGPTTHDHLDILSDEYLSYVTARVIAALETEAIDFGQVITVPELIAYDLFTSEGEAAGLKVTREDSVTNAISTLLTLTHNTTGTPASGLASAIDFKMETSTTESTLAGRIQVEWQPNTHASRTSDMVFSVEDDFDGTLEEYVRIDGSAKTVRVADGTGLQFSVPTTTVLSVESTDATCALTLSAADQGANPTYNTVYFHRGGDTVGSAAYFGNYRNDSSSYFFWRTYGAGGDEMTLTATALTLSSAITELSLTGAAITNSTGSLTVKTVKIQAAADTTEFLLQDTVGNNWLALTRNTTTYNAARISSQNGVMLELVPDTAGGAYLVLASSKTTTGHPTAREGLIYYNTFDNGLFMYADGAWRTLASW